MTKLDELRKKLGLGGIEPSWSREGDTVEPLCSVHCPHHDGKRCELLGHRPATCCRPTVRAMVQVLRELEA